MSERVVAFDDFIHISGPLLALPGEPGEWLYPAEEIHALISGAVEARTPSFSAALVESKEGVNPLPSRGMPGLGSATGPV